MTIGTTFKKAATQLLQTNIYEKKAFPISWTCSYCGKEHTGNLLKKVASLNNEVISGELNADIGLFTEKDELFAAIHISKNKKPTEAAVNFYRSKNIIYLQVVSGEDIPLNMAAPLFVGTCLNPRCSKCNGFQTEKSLVIVDSSCWKCKGPMKVAVLEATDFHGGPDIFTPVELELAREKGAVIQSNYSQTVRGSYLSNTCPHCQVLKGDHYLFTDHYADAMYGYLKYESYPLGYFCEACAPDHYENLGN